MPYTKQTWADNDPTKPASAARFNYMETGIQTAQAAAEAAQATASAAVPATLVDAKGDLLVGTGNDALARLPVGVDDYMLVADSTDAFGLAWKAVATGSGIPATLYDANTILMAVADNTPLPVTIGASTFVGRKATGDPGTMTGAEAGALIKLDQLAAPTDVTTLNVTTSAHGLMPKLPGGTTTFFRADGSFATPSGSSPGADIATAIVVAAADSTAEAKAAATLVLTGTSGNGVDDAAAIEAAASGGLPLALMPGNYWGGSTLDGTLFGNHVYSIVPGKAIWNMRSNVVDGFLFLGDVDNTQATLAASATKGTSTLTITAAGTVANGQIFNLQGNDQFFTDKSYVGAQYDSIYKGEWIEVASGGGTTNLTLKRALFDSYTLTGPPTLRRLNPVRDVLVEGIVFKGAGQVLVGGSPDGVAPGGLANQIAVRIQYFVNATVRKCGFFDLSDEGVRWRAGIDAVAEACYGQRVSNLNEPGSVLKMMGVENGRFINNSGGEDCRHLTDVDGYWPDPPSRGIVMSGNISKDTYKSGLGSHLGIDGMTVTGNICIRGGAGIMSRGPNAVISNNVCIGPFTGGYAGAFVTGDGNDTSKNGRAGEGLVMTNNIVIGNQTATSSPNVRGFYFYDSCYGARITGNRVSGVTGHHFESVAPQNHDTFFEDNTSDCTGMKASQDVFHFDPADPAAGRNQRSLVLRNNLITVAPTGVAVRIIGPTTGTPSTAVEVSQNDFRGAAVTITNLVTSPVVRGNDGRAGVFATPITGFYVIAPAVSQTDVKFNWPSSGTSVGVVVPYTGSVVGLGLYLTSPRSAGTISVTVYVNDVAQALTCTINTNVNKNHALALSGVINFVAGDHINLRYTTDAAWATVASSTLTASIWVEQ